jgi:hypothetical protein
LTSDLPPGPGAYPPPNHPSVVFPAAAVPNLPKLNGPRALAVAVSVAYVIRFTVDVDGPPAYQPAVVFPAADVPNTLILKGPLAVAVSVSVAYVILSTVDKLGPYPPPHHPAVGLGAGAGAGPAAAKLLPKIIPIIALMRYFLPIHKQYH